MQADHLTIEELSGYLDRALDEPERRRAEQHLSDCGVCQRELAEIQQTVALLRAVPNRAAPRSFRVPASSPTTDHARAATRSAPRGPRDGPRLFFSGMFQPFWLRAMSGVAAALMLVVFASDLLLGTASNSALAPAVGRSVSAPAEAPAADSLVAPQARSLPSTPRAPSNVTGAGPQQEPAAPAAVAPAAPLDATNLAAPPAAARVAPPSGAEGAVAPAAGGPTSSGAGDLASGAPAPPVAQPQAEAQRAQPTAPSIAREAPPEPQQPVAQPTRHPGLNAASRGWADAVAPVSEPAPGWLTPLRLAGGALGLIAVALLAASFVVRRGTAQ